MHRYDGENHADPGEILPELHDVVDGMTQMEEMLRSLASPCFVMRVSKGGQYKTRGNVITFSQDIGPLCTCLPRLPEALDVLVIRKNGARDPGTYKDFSIRKRRVFAFLLYLKENNRHYADITILPPEDVNLPDDANVLDRLTVVPPRGTPQQPHTSPELEVLNLLPPPFQRTRRLERPVGPCHAGGAIVYHRSCNL